MSKVVILKFKFTKNKKTDIIGVFTSAIEAKKYIDNNKEVDKYKDGYWSLSDRELIS